MPSKNGSGNFIIRHDGEVIWDRRNPETSGFPDIKDIKQRIRDRINPDIDLGHSDKKNSNNN